MVKELIDLFKEKYPMDEDDSPESGEIQLDNLDEARLIYDESGNVVVENEHGTEFPVSDLSKEEVNAFIMVLKNEWI
jgi:hypothetical protein